MRRTTLATATALLLGATMLLAEAPAALAEPGVSAEAAAVARADLAIRANGAAVRAALDDTYSVFATRVDPDGAAHVRYTRKHHGLRVRGGDFVMHAAPGGAFAGASVGLSAPLQLSTEPKVSSAAAAAAAREGFAGTVHEVGTPELMIDAASGRGRLAWETVVEGTLSKGQSPSRLHVFSDAQTGARIGSVDAIMHVSGTGNSLYSGTVPVDTTLSGGSYTLTDPLRGNGVTCDGMNVKIKCDAMLDLNNIWGSGVQSNRQTAAVDVHFGVAQAYDYFKNVHGRSGIFGDGRGVPARVHYGEAISNAFWNGDHLYMMFGDGPGNSKPLVSLDVVAHEMSHGVTQFMVPGGLIYESESGGLNEATSDIFGTMVEFQANVAADRGDYLIGEKIDLDGDGTPFRYMYNPALDNVSHSCWSAGTKDVNTHFSSGVGNHFFFMLAEGSGATAFGTSPVCGSARPVTGIGRDKAAKIWFRALDVYFTSTTSYVDPENPDNTARAYTLSAAADLYGMCSREYKAVQSAWNAVNVVGNGTTCNEVAVEVTPTAGEVIAGSAATSQVQTVTVSGNPQLITLSVTGLPPGVVGAFNPATVLSGGTSTLTITASAGLTSATYPVTITGTAADSSTHSANYTLTVRGDMCASPGQKLGNPGFEVGTAPWAGHTHTIGSSGRTPHSGTRFAWLGGNGVMSSEMISQTFALPTACADYDLTFWMKIDSAEPSPGLVTDKLTVRAVTNLGSVTLATFSNRDAGANYVRHTIPLDQFAGKQVTLQLMSSEDASRQTSFVIDDVAVNVA
ncbi:M4 family metallopeptidase [Catellatospora aurea]|uniref:M4 family metallopeptidase n=1 Tax=Catellatospora aurea TaxID=1337874 RepID=A0ABW2H6Y9_9ACTN